MLIALLALVAAAPAPDALSVRVDQLLPALVTTYEELHAHPELSMQEHETSKKMAARLTALGFRVTTGVGGTGVVGVRGTGARPVVLVRTDLDALPIEEKTGAKYASKARSKNDEGEEVSVMHACGHDVHMSAWLGAAEVLAARTDFPGTLVFIAQPAEEIGRGARAMLADGLLTRFPKPDAAIALHTNAELPAGTLGWHAGPSLASVDSVDVVLKGKGGHGAYPHRTIDPVVLAARVVLGVQTLVSRENDPLEPAVITVGAIHGGTQHNIIPDEVALKLTVRAYRDDVRKRLHAGIARVAKGEAIAAGAPEPVVRVDAGPSATVNEPALTMKLVEALRTRFGADHVVEMPPVMGGEDFGEIGRAGVSASMIWLGVVDRKRFEASRTGGAALPSLHSAQYLPDAAPSIRTGVIALVTAVHAAAGIPSP